VILGNNNNNEGKMKNTSLIIDALVESLNEIVEHLESIADSEGFKISDHPVYQRAKQALKAAGK
jgi:hypothetical protein